MQNLAAIIEQLNSLYAAPEIEAITTLDLQNRSLNSIPEDIWGHKSLTTLSLANNRLTEIPAQIVRLINLTELWMGGNSLSSLPEQIGQLHFLTELGLGNNNLTELPNSIDSLINLQYLDLSGNKFTRLPIALGNLAKLSSLDLHDNRLSILPYFLKNLTNLTSINLNGNPIADLSILTEIPNLCYAQFNGMQLTRRYWTRVSDWQVSWIRNEPDSELRGQLIDYFDLTLELSILESRSIEESARSDPLVRLNSDLSDMICDRSILDSCYRSQSPQSLLNLHYNYHKVTIHDDIRGDPD